VRKAITIAAPAMAGPCVLPARSRRRPADVSATAKGMKADRTNSSFIRGMLADTDRGVHVPGGVFGGAIFRRSDANPLKILNRRGPRTAFLLRSRYHFWVGVFCTEARWPSVVVFFILFGA
jgi:hypothetical protein